MTFLDFIETYGWALLVVLAFIGVLAYFGIFSPSTTVENKTTALPDNQVVSAFHTGEANGCLKGCGAYRNLIMEKYNFTPDLTRNECIDICEVQ
jgi:hypothetical protein